MEDLNKLSLTHCKAAAELQATDMRFIAKARDFVLTSEKIPGKKKKNKKKAS